MDDQTLEDISKIEDCKYVSDSLSRPNLKLFHWRFENLGMKMLALDKLLSILSYNGLDKGIIYFNTAENAKRFKEIFEQLKMKRHGQKVFWYNLGLYFGKEDKKHPYEEKLKDAKKFAKSKQMKMTATCAFGEGLDFDDVQFVVCMEMPGSIEELYQLVGRAGRNYENAPVFLMDDPHGRKSREIIIDHDKNSEQSKEFQWEKYNELLDLIDKKKAPLTMEDLVEKLER